MGLVLKEEGTRTLHPAGGFMAVCVDVVDLGLVESEWQGNKRQRHMCRLVFETGETMADGRPFTIGRRFTASLHENAALRAFLEQWRGRAFTPDELKGFDTEVLIGIAAAIQVVHTERNGRTFDDINSIMKPMKGLPTLKPSGKYIRVKDRAPAQAAQNGAVADEHDFPPPLDDHDDLPF